MKGAIGQILGRCIKKKLEWQSRPLMQWQLMRFMTTATECDHRRWVWAIMESRHTIVRGMSSMEQWYSSEVLITFALGEKPSLQKQWAKPYFSGTVSRCHRELAPTRSLSPLPSRSPYETSMSDRQVSKYGSWYWLNIRSRDRRWEAPGPEHHVRHIRPAWSPQGSYVMPRGRGPRIGRVQGSRG